MPRSRASAPKVFISYSWDDEAHKDWVRELAARLTGEGVDVTLDQWHAVPGDQLPEFMERVIRRSRYVLIICTPRYKRRADKRLGGVGYEGDIMTAEVFEKKSPRRQQKFIPVLRAGTWEQSGPSWLRGKYWISLEGDPYSEKNYDDLLMTLHDARPKPPIPGQRPEKFRIQSLREQLKSTVAIDRRYAAEALGNLGPAAGVAVPALATALRDGDNEVRRSAAVALGGIGPAAKDALPALVAALKDDDNEVREWAADALHKIGLAAHHAK